MINYNLHYLQKNQLLTLSISDEYVVQNRVLIWASSILCETKGQLFANTNT